MLSSIQTSLPSVCLQQASLKAKGGESYFQCSFNVNHFFFSLRWSASVHFGVCSECVGNECVMIFWSMVSVLGSGWGSFSPDAICLNRKIDCYIFSISLISRFLLMELGYFVYLWYTDTDGGSGDRREILH